MKFTLLTSLPVTNNAGASTLPAVARLFAGLVAAGIEYTAVPGARGIWYEGDAAYLDDTVLVYLRVRNEDVDAARRLVAAFGKEADQLAMLFSHEDYLGRGRGEDDWRYLARGHGGATLLPNGVCFSLNFAGLMQGRDY